MKTSQHVLPDLPPVENFPMREWSIEIVQLDKDGNEIPASLFEKVTYHLHPTFNNPNRTFTELPFKITEQGWGGFPLNISLFLIDKGGERKITHDLNFLQDAYEVDHEIQVPHTKPTLVEELAKSGPIEEEIAAISNSKRKATVAPSVVEPKTKRVKLSVTPMVKGDIDIEKLAFGLTKLKEDDLVAVVQMIPDNKTAEMNITNDVEEGEFTMDLFSLPDSLLKSLWEYVEKNVE